ncbi:MAG: nucleotidyltransferase family protein [Bacteroidales bacterium]|nr:nucleotidyltransferase family protein [Bacteroidales bacterium]
MVQAMIFAAGLGTRLQPITNTMPKALVEVGGITLLEHAVRHLHYYGVNSIVVNVHHFAEKVINKAYELEKKYTVTIQISDERSCLLETGGGLKKASHYFQNASAIILYNADILSNLDLNELIDHHFHHKPLATLSVRSRKTHRYFLFNENMELCGWKNMLNNEIKICCSKIQKLTPLAFSGIQIVSPEMLSLIQSWGNVFSMTDVYIRLCPFYRILGLFDKQSLWFDIGTPEKLNEANEHFKNYNL